MLAFETDRPDIQSCANFIGERRGGSSIRSGHVPAWHENKLGTKRLASSQETQEKKPYLAFCLLMIQTTLMSDPHLSEQMFTPIATRDGTYCIRMDPQTDAPVLYIGSFDTESDAEVWIRNESAAWVAKRRPRLAPNRRRGRVANVK